MLEEVKAVVPCVYCQRDAKRHSIKSKKLNTENGKEHLMVSKHYCSACDKYFTNPDGEKHAPLHRNVSWGLLSKVLLLVESKTLEDSCHEVYKDTGYRLSSTTLHGWVLEKEDLLERMPEKLLEVWKTGKET